MALEGVQCSLLEIGCLHASSPNERRMTSFKPTCLSCEELPLMASSTEMQAPDTRHRSAVAYVGKTRKRVETKNLLRLGKWATVIRQSASVARLFEAQRTNKRGFFIGTTI